jgi:uncharacterized membrane protein
VFFSDAVFAIAITLLALDLHIPNGLPPDQVASHLQHIIPQVLTFVLSFFVIGLYWIAHHRVYRYIVRFDHRLLLLNLLLLLFIAILPFPTRLLGSYGDLVVVTVVYSVNVAAVGLLQLAIWRYASRRRRLVAPHFNPEQIRSVTMRFAPAVAVFVLSIGVGFLSVNAARVLWFLGAGLAAGLEIWSFIDVERELRPGHS